MRVTESKTRGLRAESGMRTPNSASNADTRSASAKESSSPDSKSESSGAGSMGFPASRRRISMILVRLSMRGPVRCFQADFLVGLVLADQIFEQCSRQPAVTGDGKVNVVGLRQAGGDPVKNGAL